MKLTDIQTGKRYWKKVVVNDSRSAKALPLGQKIYVVQIDLMGRKVMASVNGSPARWFNKHEFARWKTEDPTSKLL